ncbi:hypothetical protein CTA1_4041 [Colletotrichum tanaceti]|uniref:Uncharacterized protein n=1 Tax=Colletotrichum tanaceti TaxID=1306861 RepID=A0A4U6XJR8_9PEZI|nr:hypothetical protein CTA1_4041 [Colletotrichum tanaceti]
MTTTTAHRSLLRELMGHESAGLRLSRHRSNKGHHPPKGNPVDAPGPSSHHHGQLRFYRVLWVSKKPLLC